jgi:hypothetical protein
MSDTIDINISPVVENVTLTIEPNLTTINVNTINGGGGAVDSVNTQTGDVVLDQDDILDGTTYKQYSLTEKNKLAGIQAGAEVNVNADWNADSGDAQILNKPTIPSITNLVPYTGATQDVNLGEFGMLTGNLEFDNTPTNIPTNAGGVYWNNTDGTLDLILKGGNVKLQIGQESVIRVVNKTATNINLLEANYQAVRVTGVQGQRLKVDLAQATTDILSAETIGLVTETINNNQEGFITTSGLVRNINTTGSLQGETWADGDILYLSPTVAGRITKVKPSAPNHLVIIGYVIHSHVTQGSIFVKVDNGYELDELHNVKIDTPLNNQSLVYNSTLEVWENKTITIDATPTDGSSNAVSSNGVFDALALKQDKSKSETFVLSKANGTFGSHTGTTAETVLFSADISANEFTAGDFMRVMLDITKLGTAGTASVRLRAGTTGTTSDALIGTLFLLSGTLDAGFIRERFQFLSGNLLSGIQTSYTANQTDIVINSVVKQSTSLTPSNAWKITVSVALANSADTVSCLGYRVSKIKTI